MQEEVPKQAKLYDPIPTIVITVGVYLLSQLIAGVIISIVPIVKHWTAEYTNAWLKENVWATFAFVVLVEVITLYIVHIFLKKRSLNFGSLGLKAPQLKHIAYALSGFAVYLVLYVVALIIIKTLVPSLDLEQKQEIGFRTTTEGFLLIPVFISLVVLPPVTEEIVARGFLYGGLRTKLPIVSATVITSILFSAPHLGATSNGLLWVAGIDTFILSMVLCYLREKTGSLWSSIGLHMIKNSLAFIVLFNIMSYIR